jgi:error-prone DNA polymerase
MEYIELHTHSNFSFLDGASHPEDLVSHAARLGYSALALTDHGGLYGIVRFNSAARLTGVKPIFGAEITLENGHHLTLIAKDHTGYSNLSQLLTTANLRCKKGETKITRDELANHHDGLIALSGCHLGETAALLMKENEKNAEYAASAQREIFGDGNYYLEMQHHNLPLHEVLCEKLHALGRRLHIPIVATNNVHFTTPDGRRLQDILTCIKHHTNLDEAGGLLYPNAERYLRPPEEMIKRFARYPDAIANTKEIADRCDFTLESLKTSLPDFHVPDGYTTISYLRELSYRGAKERYPELTEKVVAQIEHELAVIEKLDLAGYFLIVWDIARFCRDNGILCQGRGSAANSAVCYCLGITAVDPISLNLLFERFVSEERREAPDIDIDIANNRREEVIQYVYNRYGRRHAAMVCEVISYRGRSAVRDVGKALGFTIEEVDRLAKLLDHFSGGSELVERVRDADLNVDDRRVRLLIELVAQIRRFPRHLGIHVGGMIITKSPLSQIVPIENATMPNRSVVAWDKDDVGDLGMVKIDILGLGMLSLIDIAFKLIEKTRGKKIDPALLSYDDPKVYDLLCSADTLGVFQVESRAQMNTLPRLRPRRFYDLVVEVALIRPGPIQGDMVHPYLRRRNGEEQVTYPHPSLEPILRRTLGVPLFQEQTMQIAIAAAGFSPGQADALRRAMGHKRSRERMEAISVSLIAGLVKNGIDENTALRIFKQMSAFADYGFPESHAASFALLVYVSAYLKLYFPEEFYCSLLNAQPMGFYSPSSVVYEAKRKGIRILGVNVTRSLWDCTIEMGGIRLGFRYVKQLGGIAKEAIEREIARRPFHSIEDFVTRTKLNQGALEQLATVGAFECFGFERRQALWAIMSLAKKPHDELPIEMQDNGGQLLNPMATYEELIADFQGMDLSTGMHPMKLVRPLLAKRGVLASNNLTQARNGSTVAVAGVVIIRQRPMTAKGFMFLTLEDETGLINVVVKPAFTEKFRRKIVSSSLLLVRGTIEHKHGVTNVIGREFLPLQFKTSEINLKSRDFR